MSKLFTISYGSQSYRLSVNVGEYGNGRLAVELMEVPNGSYFATASVNVGELPMAKDEFVFKTYSENAGLFEAMLAAGIIENTGRSVELGFSGPQPICRLVSN